MDMDKEIENQVAELAGAIERTARPTGKPTTQVLHTPRVEADPDRYDFAKLGETIASSLIQAAQAHANNANVILEQTQEFADYIRSKITEKSTELDRMNTSLKAFGETLLDAHRKFTEDQIGK